LEPTRPLDCFEALQRLEDYLDRELSPQVIAEIDAHLAICATCAREFAFESGVLRGLKARLRRAPIPEDLRWRIAAILSRASMPPPDP
jgi:anti-sigma factor (TIGR02949 family)